MPFRGFIQFCARWFLSAACLAPAAGYAQTEELPNFGTTVVIPGGLTGKIYFLKPNTWVLPNFEKLEPVGTIYTKELSVRPRYFTEGFPGITDRVEWFAIDFTGRIYIDKPGDYLFQVESDDGSILYIDQKMAIDNDGDHPPVRREALVRLTGGMHSIRLSYFQGPGTALALMLSVAGPGDRKPRPFNTDEFKPPSNPEDWKYGKADDWKETPGLHLSRRTPEEANAGRELVSVPVEVLSHAKPVLNLKQSDFLLYDNKEPKEIRGFGFEDHVLDIMLLIEDSAGMRPFRARAAELVQRAMSKLDRRDHVGVVAFGDGQQLILGLAARPDRVEAAIRQGGVGGGAADLNGAVALTAQYLRENARTNATRAIVILTGNNGRRGVSDRAARDALWQSNVMLSGLMPKTTVAKIGGADEASVTPFIEATGGDALIMDPKNIPLGEIFQRLRERYLITYRAAEGQPKSIRNISIDLTAEAKARLRDIRICAPGGYVIEPR